MYYNDVYINEFQEKQYIGVLDDYSKLNRLRDVYLNKYNDNVKKDVIDILFKESLEHYLLKKITEDLNFINTVRMHNYMKFFTEIYRVNKMELNTNVLFKDGDIRNKILKKFYPEQEYVFQKNYEIYNRNCDLIIEKMKNNLKINSNELNYVCEYLAKLRAPEIEENKIIMKYIFSNIENKAIEFTPQVKDFILSYLPYFYKEANVKNVRMVLGDSDNKRDINGPGHSSGKGKYVALNNSCFKNINSSIQNSFVERLVSGNDFTFFMIVAFHELTHQFQKRDVTRKLFYNEIMGYIIYLIMKENLHDYSYNHDAYEIEIDANYKGWEKCHRFYCEFYNGSNRSQLISNCIKNSTTAQFRRMFSQKRTSTGEIVVSNLYDIGQLVSIVKQHPDLIECYPMLNNFFNENGKIQTKFIYNLDLYTDSVGLEFINYFIEKGGIQRLISEMNNRKFLNSELIHIINNLYYYVNGNFRKVEDLDRLFNYNNIGEYRMNRINSNKDYKELQEFYYKLGLKYYEIIFPVFDIIKKQYPEQNHFIEVCMNHLNKSVDKYGYVIENIDKEKIKSI